MGVTTDRNDPRLTHGVDDKPVQMADAYLVLPAEGDFVRPVRQKYLHVGIAGPKYPLRDLTGEEADRYAGVGYVKFEAYPRSASGPTGRYWTQVQLDSVGKGCGAATTMGLALAETYARDPHFYGATFCVGCRMHRPVGRDGEFVWDGTTDRVGT